MTINHGQEAGRKRLAKLLGVAPYRVDLQIEGTQVRASLDDQPLNLEQMAAFAEDVAKLTTSAKRRMN